MLSKISSIQNNNIVRFNSGFNYQTSPEFQANQNSLEVQSNTSKACYSYSLAQINQTNNLFVNPEYFNLSLEEHLAKLKSEGKIEGQDYTCEIQGILKDRCWIELKNNQGQVTDRLEYNDGRLDNAEINIYKQGKLYSTINRNKERIECISKNIYDEAVKQELFNKYHLNNKTTPSDFVKYLKENDIKYDISYSDEEGNNRSVNIKEYDKYGNIVRQYCWYYGENSFKNSTYWVSVSDIKENEEIRRTHFDEDKIEVVNYFDSTSSKTYNNNEVDISKLSKLGITYNTSVDEYLNKLEEKKQNIL